MITVNALGEACPMPVVKAKKAIDALTAPETVQVLVDNDAAVQNLIRLAGQYGFAVRAEKQGEAQFSVTIDAAGVKKDVADEAVVCAPLKQRRAYDGFVVCAPLKQREKNIVVAISKDHMGEGEEALGKTLLKAFIFALTQQDALPKTILFYNSGAFVTSTDGPSIEDLKTLEAQGVDILTCGTCLDYYHRKEKLLVGGITNMYSIVETLEKADVVVKP